MHYKSKIALAVLSALALPGLALAQTTADKGTMKGIVSTVEWELYGHLYPEYNHVSQSGASATSEIQSTLGGAAAPTVTSHYELNTANSRVGLRAQRAMGSGIKAIAQLEYTVNIDITGANISARNSFLGIESKFGTVKLGIMDTVYKEVGDTVSMFGISSGNFVSMSNILSKQGFGTSSSGSFHLRRANSVQYVSPEIGGAQFMAQYSPDEVKSDTRNADLISLGVSYNNKGLYLGLAHEIHNDLFGGSRNVPTALQNTTNAAASSKDTATRGTVGYKFGDTRAEVNYAMMKYDESGPLAAGKFQNYKHNAWSVTVEQGFGPATVSVGYVAAGAGSCSRAGGTACSTSGLDGNQFQAGLRYSWPEASVFLLYAKLVNGASAQYNNTAADTVSPGTDVSQIAAGISFRF